MGPGGAKPAPKLILTIHFTLNLPEPWRLPGLRLALASGRRRPPGQAGIRTRYDSLETTITHDQRQALRGGVPGAAPALPGQRCQKRIGPDAQRHAGASQ